MKHFIYQIRLFILFKIKEPIACLIEWKRLHNYWGRD